MENWVFFVSLAALLADICLTGFIIARQDRFKSGYLTALSLCVSLCALGSALETAGGGSAEAVRLALIVKSLGLPMAGPFFALAAVNLINPRGLRPWMPASALAYGLVMFGLMLSNDFHRLYYASVVFGASSRAVIERGPLYFVLLGVSLACAFASCLYLFKRREADRARAGLITAAVLLALALCVMYFLGLTAVGFEIMPPVITAALALFAANAFRHRFRLHVIDAATKASFETMDDVMIVLDDEFRLLACNKRAKLIFPFLEALPAGGRVTDSEEWPRELRFGKDAAAGAVTFRLANREGGASARPSAYRAGISPVAGLADARHIGWSIVIRDISDMARLMEKMEELATTDPLTGILDRRKFLQMVQRELDMAQRHKLSMALMMYDLDMFKKVNDEYGHAVGDYVLCAVVEIIRKQLRSYDIYARYGGEEFVIFTVAGEGRGHELFAERLRQKIASTRITYEGKHIPVTASFGVVKMTPGVDFETAMMAVDKAMYEAKARGRNQTVAGEIERA